ncbi:hypothetical protein N9L68_04240 [bacterium]|nr:hypothetical protein [bacterium]
MKNDYKHLVLIRSVSWRRMIRYPLCEKHIRITVKAIYTYLVSRVLPVMQLLVLTFHHNMYTRQDPHQRHNLLRIGTPKRMERFEKGFLIAYHMRITFAITGEQLFIGFVKSANPYGLLQSYSALDVETFNARYWTFCKRRVKD